GNVDQLARLFLNLLDNAIKYTPPGGTVRVRAEAGDAVIAVTVADTGPGIPPEHLPRLFDRFYRVDSDRARRSGGAGLVLAIVQEIARLHGASLTVESKPGDGTTVRVQLAAVANPGASRSLAATVTRETSSS